MSEPLDFSSVRLYPIADRDSKISLEHMAKTTIKGGSLKAFFEGLPALLKAKDLLELVGLIVNARQRGRSVIFGMGAHVIKCGLSPLVIDLMERGVVNGVALNGAGSIHDLELALEGRTSEDVTSGLEDGSFGMAGEPGEFINRALRESCMGYGAAIGRAMVKEGLPHIDVSILGAGHRLSIPVTVHVAIGTDVFHVHPTTRGEDLGRASFTDFKILCSMIRGIDSGGVFLNIGSVVVIPEVFLKAVNVLRNLGFPLRDFYTANFDMIPAYRPLTNVVGRPTAGGGRGYNFTGHHEIMIPLLFAAILERL